MIPLLVHQTFTYGTFVLSLFTNIAFIGISTTTHSDSIGRYRYLMIGFAVTDIIVSITHLVLMPGIQLTSAGYIFFGYHLVNKPAVVGTWAVTFFVIFFYQTFIVLALHYIYRYAVVCEPRWRKIFTRNTTILWTFISSIAQLLYSFGYLEAVQIGFLPSDYKRAFFRQTLLDNAGVDNSKYDFGYVAVIFRKPSADSSSPAVWQDDAIAAILLAISLFGITAIIIIACSIAILRQLASAKSSLISEQMLKTQHALLTALIVQTLIPCIFSYIPLGMVFVVPFMGLNLTGIYGDLMIMSTAIFPAIDPLIMLYFVRSYRTRIMLIWKVLVNPNLTHVHSLSNGTMSAAAVSA